MQDVTTQPQSIKHVIATITPQEAKKLLKGGWHNRPYSKHWVNILTERIQNGEWEINGESIKLDKKGKLLDGQHRLLAVIKADTPITTSIISNIDAGVFDTIDTGRPRNLSDVLSILKEDNARPLSSAIRLSMLYDRHKNSTLNMMVGTRRISNREALGFLNDNPGLRDSVEFGVIGHKQFRYMSAGTIAFCHYLFSQIDNKDTNDFFSKLFTGLNITIDSPIITLREKLIFMSGNRRDKIRADFKAACIIKAWNKYRRGDTSRYYLPSPKGKVPIAI